MRISHSNDAKLIRMHKRNQRVKIRNSFEWSDCCIRMIKEINARMNSTREIHLNTATDAFEWYKKSTCKWAVKGNSFEWALNSFEWCDQLKQIKAAIWMSIPTHSNDAPKQAFKCTNKHGGTSDKFNELFKQLFTKWSPSSMKDKFKKGWSSSKSRD